MIYFIFIDILFACLMTCVDNKPLTVIKSLLDAYWDNVNTRIRATMLYWVTFYTINLFYGLNVSRPSAYSPGILEYVVKKIAT